MMIDVDNFKSFNDTYGHQAGDRVLQAVARVLDNEVRRVDHVARYGGDEFVVVAPTTSDDGLLMVAERLRQAVEATRIEWKGQRLGVTVSIGVAVFFGVKGAEEAPKIIRVADEQLYAAKCAGRNRVHFKTKREDRVAVAPLADWPSGANR